MEEGELGQAPGRAKLLQGPFLPILQAKWAAAFGKIELVQEPGHPDIHGEGVPTAVGVQQDAPGDFGADSGQVFEVFRGPFRGPGLRDFQKFRLLGEDFGGGGEVFGAIAELALAEPLFPRPGETGRGGKIPARSAEREPEPFIDLADLDDLLEGGADEVGEAFPGILAERAQAGMDFAGLGEPPVPGGARNEKQIKVEIQIQILFHGAGRKEGIVPNQMAMPKGEGDGLASDPAGEFSGGALVPAEGLAAQESGGKVERNGELQGRHDGEKLKAG